MLAAYSPHPAGAATCEWQRYQNPWERLNANVENMGFIVGDLSPIEPWWFLDLSKSFMVMPFGSQMFTITARLGPLWLHDCFSPPWKTAWVSAATSWGWDRLNTIRTWKVTPRTLVTRVAPYERDDSIIFYMIPPSSLAFCGHPFQIQWLPKELVPFPSQTRCLYWVSNKHG